MNQQQYHGPAQNMLAYQAALHMCLAGPELIERDQKYRTWDAAQIVFDAKLPILFNFGARKLNVRYAVEEFLWYVRADRRDNSIERFANAWKKLSQEDGSFFSNYGHYIFSKMTPDGVSAFRFAGEQLMRNPSSRRAAIPLLETKHCFHSNVDMVCTFAIQFFIRQNRLDMIVNMRSNDVVWGLTNDAFCFLMLQRLMYVKLKQQYPTLQLGTYTHCANTLHVYERHYEMAERIVKEDVRGLALIDPPVFSDEDVHTMLQQSTEGLTWVKNFLASSPT